MPILSARSLARLETCHPLLQEVVRSAIVDFNFTVLCGHRNEAEQNTAVAAGKSKLAWPASKHNALPALAVDLAPWPVDWSNVDRFKSLAVHILDVADALGIKLRWGGDWNMNGRSDDERFIDFPHFELVDPPPVEA